MCYASLTIVGEKGTNGVPELLYHKKYDHFRKVHQPQHSSHQCEMAEGVALPNEAKYAV